jgi:flagellar biosynthesis protein FlhF
MQIRRYYGKSVHAALKKAKAELGPEAVLLHTRTLKSNLLGGSTVEVIVAVDKEAPSAIDEIVGNEKEEIEEEDEPIERAKAVLTANSYRRAEGEYELKHIGEELSEIRDLLHILMSSVKKDQSSDLPETVRGLYEKFIRNEVDPAIAYDLAKGLEPCFSDEGGKLISERLAELIAKAVKFTGGITLQGEPRTVALIGPTGVGKTTTVAKLAAHFKLKFKRKVALVTIDTYRIAAVHQLQIYADIIRTPLKVANDPQQLSEEVKSLSDHDLILIDTPGRSQYDVERIAEIERFMTALPQVEIHLLISASTRNGDVYEILDGFGGLGVDGLIFTKLDETARYGAILNAAVRSGRPLSYFTTGQDAAGDIEVATVEKIASLLLRGLRR